MNARHLAAACAALLAASAIGAPQTGAAALAPKPSRAAENGCKWEKFSDAGMGLDAWVQRCDFGHRKINFVAAGHSLAQRWSDGSGKPDPLVDVLELKPGESPEKGIRRLFDERTDKKLAPRCVLAPWTDPEKKKAPTGVKRYTFEPNAALAKELKAKQSPDEVPDPPCGDWGDTPDGIQYWEAQPSNSTTRVLFVRVGQDAPLYDENTLHLR